MGQVCSSRQTGGPMRLVFFYTQYGPADCTKNVVWNPHAKTENFYATEIGGLRSEGYMWLLKRLKETKVFDDILIIIESARSPGSTTIEGIPCLVVPLIRFVHEFLLPDDIIWIRGGFRSWYTELEKFKANNQWLLLYGANTGRERWSIWDVIFSDYATENRIDRLGRLWTKFNKPTRPDIFFPEERETIYDVCVGASHIHDRKGQWRTIKALNAFKLAHKRNLRAIMPGRFMRGGESSYIQANVGSWGLDVVCPGMVNRPQLREYFNQSKLFVYLGESGQNDRGPHEALACGTPIIIANPRYHQPEIYNNPFCRIANNRDFDSAASTIREALAPCDRKEVAAHYRKINGAEEVVLPKMSFIFKTIQELEKPNVVELARRMAEWQKGQ
jgi:glycosyltransferase involved in cell wall biosynthesis